MQASTSTPSAPRLPAATAPSHIPLLTPTPRRSSTQTSRVPSSLSLPQLVLVPPSRLPSSSLTVSTPRRPSPGPSPNANNSGSGLSSFRSLRNLLPFGSSSSSKSPSRSPTAPRRTASTSSALVAPSSSSLASRSLGSIRRSLTGDRGTRTSPRSSPALSGQALRSDSDPVLSIAPEPSPSASSGSHSPSASAPLDQVQEQEGHDEPFLPHLPSTSSYGEFGERTVRPLDPDPDPTLQSQGATDLSTILEADTSVASALSGLSKHLPPLSDDDSPSSSPASPAPFSSHALRGTSSNLRPSPSPLLDIRVHLQGEEKEESAETAVRARLEAEMPGHDEDGDEADDSALDLSTTHLDAEVRGALLTTAPWTTLTPEIRSSASPSPSPPPSSYRFPPPSPGEQYEEYGETLGLGDALTARRGPAQHPDESLDLNLSALDPDLAALLSPHRFAPRRTGPHPAVLAAANAIPPPATTPSPPPRPSLERTSSSPSAVPRYGGGKLSPSPSPRSPAFTRGSPGPSSNSSSPLTASFLPDHEHDSEDDTARRASVDGLPRRKLYAALSSGRPAGIAGNTSRRASEEHARPSRYATPARPASRPALSHLQMTPASEESHQPPPSSRPPSSAARLLHRRPPSTDQLPTRASATPSRQDVLDRLGRRRGASVSTSSPSSAPAPSPLTRPGSSAGRVRPALDLLGPRTLRAFASAGLMDPASDSSSPRSVSQQGHYAARGAPSRLAHSERPWSRAGAWTPDRDGHGRRPSMETSSPTVYSGATPRSAPSTTYTSVSAASTHARELADKHQAEMGTLLAALADAQASGRALREENDALRRRVEELEDALGEARAELRVQRHHQHRQQQQQQPRHAAPPPLDFGAMGRSRVFERPSTASGSVSGAGSRPPSSQARSHSRVQNLSSSSAYGSHGSLDPPARFPEEDTARQGRAQHQRRSSTASSVFPLPPSNMSLLMSEDNTAVAPLDRSVASFAPSAPPSPTLVYAARHSSGPLAGRRRGGHAPKQASVASMESISPSTANYSVLTGSPGSLNLQPEHDRHLLDLDMLSLDIGSGAEDSGREGSGLGV
ncbi:hypothetical protein PUNSTDRAFT_145627 [Punctularia strigosozonata HHB-11173 SS5]|uniref:uncharacterized protein n=1 Tax=Punctularia strigosozonata (strain HHB-11173) TaxID=741275 RepID=UPI0004416F64|nr:uncharacterized protein PUNSTDRAFT_145627 [Punctularia strigosozonata HHB-11173 SS5]EIN05661.1 hypothetical protein PUNSTDRAFT_145627 [Punctularia strigosozonata HHB-11173 SS5]